MDYIWDIIIKAKNEGMNLGDIKFKLASSYSPYMELSNIDLNFEAVENEVEINPYYRFFEIFKNLFLPDEDQYQELRETLLDIIIHFLGQTDLKQGMDRVEHHKSFIYREIKNGCFGENIKNGINLFSIEEKNILLQNIYQFYLTGNHIYYLKDTMKKIFKGSIIYLNQEFTNEILLYIKQSQTRENEKKLQVIKELFLPVNFDILVYWEYHFGILGVNRTMRIDKISIY